MKPNLWKRFKDVESPNIDNEDSLRNLMGILQKAALRREEEDLGKIFHTINHNNLFNNFFNEMPEESSISLLSSFKHVFIPQGQEVFKFGDCAKNFYFLLKGSVFIIAPIKQDHAQGDQQAPKPQKQEATKNQGGTALPHLVFPRKSVQGQTVIGKRRATILGEMMNKGDITPGGAMSSARRTVIHGSKVIDSLSQLEFDEPITVDEIKALYPNHVLYNTLKAGDTFGEIALTSRSFRTATVVCREPCHFLILNSSSYYRILSDWQESVQQELFEFFHTLSFLRNWPNENIMGLMRQIKTVKAKRNHVFYDYGDACDKLYIVRQGEVEITKQADKDLDDEDLYKINSHTKIPLNMDQKDRINFNHIWKNQQQQIKRQYVRIALLGRQQLFGDEEIVRNSDQRISRAVVTSLTAEIFEMSTEKFIENAPDPDAFYELLSRNVKKDWRERFEKNLVKINFQNNLKVKPSQLEMDNNAPHFIPIQGTNGLMKTDQRKIRRASIQDAPKDSFRMSTQRMSTQPTLYPDDGYDEILSARSHVNTLRSYRNQRPTISKSIQLPGGVSGLLVTVNSPLATENDALPQRNKLWNSNVAHHKNRPIGMLKKHATTKSLRSSINSAKGTQNSIDVSGPRMDQSQQSHFDLKSPSNRNRATSPSNLNLMNSSIFLTRNKTSILATMPNSPEEFPMRMHKKSASVASNNMFAFQNSQESKSDDDGSRKILNKKLGVDKLFMHEKTQKEELKVLPHLFINTPEKPGHPKSPSSMQTLALTPVASDSFSQTLGKINNTISPSILSPSLIRRLKTHLSSRDSTLPTTLPTSPTSMSMNRLNIDSSKHSRRGSLKITESSKQSRRSSFLKSPKALHSGSN